MLHQAEVARYLARIGLDTPIQTNLDGLNTLVQAQLTHVPFENLDIWSTGACPGLAVPDLYQKIVIHKRGGYCFELNTLFRALLNSLGYDAYQVIASLIHAGEHIDPPAHNVIICCLNGEKYLIDVGFGGPVPFGAMELKEGTWEGFRLCTQNGFWHLERENGEKPSFRFRDIPTEPLEMEPLNFYISQKPDSHFRHILRINQRRSDGSVYTLVGPELHLHTGGGTQIHEICDATQLRTVLQEYFGMDINHICLRQQL